MTNNPELNQTSFSERRPLYESEIQIAPQEIYDPDQSNTKKTPFYKKKFVLAAAGAFLLLMLMLIVIALTTRPDFQEEIPEDMSDQKIVNQEDPFLKRINQLEAELKEADPTKPKLIFPPVQMDLALD